ncbi:hypothetical protein B0H11DRAFT_1050595 [Mycena galericulata]|nr:hypothetical protein B0H11DRAFT_1050595 [Mycena galericulata]
MLAGSKLNVVLRLTVTARQEIILSAAVVGTPFILQHSGVGNKIAFTALGRQVLLDLPHAGQNTTDHPAVFLTWAVSGNETLEAVQQNVTQRAEAEAEWNAKPFTAIRVMHVRASHTRTLQRGPATAGVSSWICACTLC